MSTQSAAQLHPSFIKHINSFPLLDEAQERTLLLQSKSDNTAIAESAKKLLVNSNIRLVIKIARSYETTKIGLLDAIQAGLVGLCQAADNFDITNDVRFATYAPAWIKSAILNTIMRGAKLVVIGKSKNQRKLFYNLHKTMARLATLEGEATPTMIAETLGVKIKDVEDMLLRFQNESGYDVPQGEDGKSLQETIGDPSENPEELQQRAQIIKTVRAAIPDDKDLNDYERAILKYRLLTEDVKTFADIAVMFDVSKERIRQYEVALINKIKRRYLGSQTMQEKSLS